MPECPVCGRDECEEGCPSEALLEEQWEEDDSEEWK
jgi:hypothetical protein